jgi:flavin-dependent dehydrogenase
LDQFIKEDKTYAPWFADTKRVEVINCVVNLLTPIKDPFRDNTLLIGDAAWIMEFSKLWKNCLE